MTVRYERMYVYIGERERRRKTLLEMKECTFICNDARQKRGKRRKKKPEWWLLRTRSASRWPSWNRTRRWCLPRAPRVSAGAPTLSLPLLCILGICVNKINIFTREGGRKKIHLMTENLPSLSYPPLLSHPSIFTNSNESFKAVRGDKEAMVASVESNGSCQLKLYDLNNLPDIYYIVNTHEMKMHK